VNGVKLTANLGEEVMAPVFIAADPDINLAVSDVRLVTSAVLPPSFKTRPDRQSVLRTMNLVITLDGKTI